LRLLVLGSEGFIGNHCIAYFFEKGHIVYGVDLFEQPTKKYNYTKVSRLSPELDELFSVQTFDAVINAAGSGSVHYSMAHPVLDFEANSLDTIRVLDAIRKHQPACKYLHLSSAAVYGNPKKLPIQEEDLTLPLSPYGWHKLIAEHLCREYSTIFGLRTAVARPFSVYGPGLKKQLFWDVFQKINAGVEGIVHLYGTGNESRDYIFISDLITGLDTIITHGEMKGEAYNLASGIETKVEEAVSLFIKSLSLNIDLAFDKAVRPGDPLNWCADIRKLSNLGFNPSVSLDKGFAKLAKWLGQL
jgi:UDP-glucose 4-epimerase